MAPQRLLGRAGVVALAGALVVTGPLVQSAAYAVEDEFVVTSEADSGPGTLRQALLDANASPAADRIVAVDGATLRIDLASPLPAVTAPVELLLDGATVVGGAEIPVGLDLTSGATGSQVSQVHFEGFSLAHVRVERAQALVGGLSGTAPEAAPDARPALLLGIGADLTVIGPEAGEGMGPLLATEAPGGDGPDGAVHLIDVTHSGAADAVDVAAGRVVIQGGRIDGVVRQRAPGGTGAVPRLELRELDVTAPPDAPAVALDGGDLLLTGVTLEGSPPVRVGDGYAGDTGVRLHESAPGAIASTYVPVGTDLIEYAGSPPAGSAALEATPLSTGGYSFVVAGAGWQPGSTASVVLGSVSGPSCTSRFDEQATATMTIDGDGVGSVEFDDRDLAVKPVPGDLVRAVVTAATPGVGESLPALSDCAATPDPASMPLVFIPGVLGSEIWCRDPSRDDPEREWAVFRADGVAMALQPDGVTDANAFCAPRSASYDPEHRLLEGQSGIAECLTAAGVCLEDVYGEALGRIEDVVGPRDLYAFGWDWRKDTAESLERLDLLVESILDETGAPQVQLLAHSYGGLLVRDYVEDPGRRAKIGRVTTVGTPYLGSPKSMLPLLTSSEMPGTIGLEAAIENGPDGLQEFSRHLRGLYNLWPSAALRGTHLVIDGDPLSVEETAQVIDDAGGASDLWRAARAKHASVWDEFRIGDLPWRMVVSGGVPTLGQLRLETPSGIGLHLTQGDGTVPLASQVPLNPPAARGRLVEDVPGTYTDLEVVELCASPHGKQMNDPALYALIGPWLADGIDPADGESCRAQRSTVIVTDRSLVVDPRPADQPSDPVDPSAGPVDVLDAEDAGLVDVIRDGEQALILMDPEEPLDLLLEPQPGQTMTVQVTDVDGSQVTELTSPVTSTGPLTVASGPDGFEVNPTDPGDPDDPDTPGAASAAYEDLLAGLSGLARSLPDLLGAFDAATPAVATGELAALYDLDGAPVQAALDPPALPDEDPATATFDRIADLLEAQGCTTDFVRGGAGGRTPAPTADDLIQVRCTRTLADLDPAAGLSSFEPDTPGFLAGLGGATGLGADDAWDAGLTLTLVVGADADGFYVLGETGARLDLGGTAGVTAGPEHPWAPSGTLAVDGTFRAGPDGSATRRLRGSETAASWALTQQGSASADLTLGIDGGSLRWEGAWIFDDAGVRDDGQVLTGRVRIPGAVDSGGGPVELVLVGTRVTEGWRLTGELSAPDGARFSGFQLTRVDADLLATDTGLTGTATARVRVPVGDEEIVVDVVLDLGAEQTTVSGTATADELTLFGGQAVLTEVEVELTGTRTGDDVTAEALLRGSLSAAGGALVVDDVEAELAADGSFSVTAAGVELALGEGTLVVDLDQVTLSFGPDAAGPLLTVASATGRIPELSGVEVTVTDLVVDRDGGFEVGSITAEVTDAPEIRIAGFLAIALDSLQISIDPDTLVIDVDARGSVDFSSLAGLPFEPVLRIGAREIAPDDPEANSFAFSVRIADGTVEPVDLGPITLGWRDLALGGHVLDGEIEFGGFADGAPVETLSGRFAISGPHFGAGLEIELDGALPGVGESTQLSGEIALPRLDFPGFSVGDLTLAAGVVLRSTPGGLTFTPRLEDLDVGSLEVPFGEFVTARAADVRLDFFPAPGAPLVSFGDDGLSLRFDDVPALAGWEGSVSHFALGPDLLPYALPGFGISISPPDDLDLGLPSWLPVRITEAGVSLPGLSSEPGGAVSGGFHIDDLAGFRIRLSGGLNLKPLPDGPGGAPEFLFPFEADLQGVEIDLAALVAGEFPITDLDGVSAGVPEFELGDVVIGGRLAIGTLQVEGERVFYVRIGGDFRMGDLGAGLDLVMTEYGPLAAEVTAPLGIPLDPTGLLLASVSGGVFFGNRSLPDPDPDDPLALLTMPAFEDFGDVSITPADLEELVRPAVQAQVPTWDTGASLFLRGNLTHAVAPVLTGAVTLGAAFDDAGELDVLLKGDVEIYGFPLGQAGFRLDLSDPVAPSYQFAFAAPPPASPLVFLTPVQADLAGVLRTDGVAEGTLLGVRSFVRRVAEGTLGASQAALGSLIDQAATSLDLARRAGSLPPLTRAVLDTDGDGSVSPAEAGVPITRARLLERLPVLLAAPPGAPAVADAVALMQELLAVLSAVAVSADSVETAADVRDALFAAIADGASDAGRTFLDVADPVLAIEGAIQPTILGVPLGTPTDSARLRIDKGGLELRVSTSFKEWLKRLVNLATFNGAGPFTEAFLSPLPQDTVSIIASLPTGDLLRALLEGADSPAAGAAASSWGVSIEGELGAFGLKFVELSGLLVPPGNEDFVREHTQPLYDGQEFDPTDLDRPVPLLTQEHEAHLIEAGGLMLTGGLQAPKLVTDPVGLFADAGLEPPADVTQLPAWLGELGERLTTIESPGFVQFYLPTPGEFERSHLVGTWDAKLLSVPLAEGGFELAQGGLTLRGTIPLLGVAGDFRILPPATSGPAAGLPRVSMDAGVEPALLRQTLLDLGVPASAIPATLPAGAVRFFSPGFDPTATRPDGSPDLLRRRGGLQVEARLTVPGVNTQATFLLDVALGPDGVPASVRGRVALTGGTLGPLSLTAAQAEITIDDSGFRVGFSGSGSLFGNTVGIAGNLASTGFGSLALTVDSDGVDLAGFALSGSLTLVRDSLGTRLTVNGTLALPAWLSAAANRSSVSVVGSFDAAGNASLTLALGTISFGSLSLGGTFRFERQAGVVRVSVSGGTLRIPGTDRNVAVNGSLDSAGLGSLTASISGGPLAFAGTPFTVAGTVALSRQLESGSVVSRVRLTNASFGWTGVGAFSVTTFDVSSTGAASVTLPGNTFALPGGAQLDLGSVAFQMGAGGTSPRLSMGESRLEIPGIGKDCPRVFGGICQPGTADTRFRIPAFDLSTADFSRVLLDGTYRLGSRITVSGQLTFAKTGNVFTVGITDTSASVPASVTLQGLFTAELDAFSLRSDGSMEIDVAAPRLGPQFMHVRNARLRIDKDAGVLGALTVTLGGGQLVPPVGAPVPLGTVTFTADLTFSKQITVALDLGPALRISSATYAVALDANGVLTVGLVGSARPTVTTLAASATLQSLTFSSAGTLDLDIRAVLELFGHRLEEATLDVDLDGGLLKIKVNDLGLDLGFAEFDVDGFVRSNGEFSLTGSFGTTLGLCNVGCLQGSVAATVSSGSGVSGSFRGKICVAGLCATASGSMTATGKVTACGTIAGQRSCLTFHLGSGTGSDTTPPAFAPTPRNLTVNQDLAGTSDRVVYPLPRATDDTSGTVPVLCTPSSGSTFTVGTTTVTCTARDASNNRTTASFVLTLVDSTPGAGPILSQVVAGAVDTRTVTGVAPLSLGTISVHSRPVRVKTFRTDRRGDATVTYRIPPYLRPGRHTVSLSVPDGQGGTFVRNWTVKVRSAPRSEQVRVTDRRGVISGRVLSSTRQCTSARRVTVLVFDGTTWVRGATVRSRAGLGAGERFESRFRFPYRYAAGRYRIVTEARRACSLSTSRAFRVGP